MSNKEHDAVTSVAQDVESSGASTLLEEKHETEVLTAVVPLDVDEPPDGGLVAWLQVAGCFCLYFNTWGMLNTFGVYQTYYQTELLSDQTPSAISWIGSVQSFLLLFVGVVAGPLYDRGHLRSLLLTGSVLVVVGMVLTSLCTRYWHVMLAQGVCVGLGTGSLFIPSIALVPQYFGRRRALAMGVVVAGSSFGGVVYAVAFQGLQPRIGFGWTMRVLGCVSLATLSVSVAVLRRRVQPARIRSLLDLGAFRETPYVLYCAALLLSNVAFFTPVFYLQSYALQHGLQDGQPVALYLVAIMNGASVLGRLAPSLVAGRLGPVQTLLACFVCTGVTTFAWIGTETGWGNVLFAVAFGFFSGGVVALPPVVLTSFTPDLGRLGTRLGMSSVLNAVGSLVGAPIGGAILRSTGSYTGVQIYAGSVIFSTAVCLLALRFVLTGRRWIAVA